MPVVHRLYGEPSVAQIQKLKRELKRYKGVKPRLAFPFAMSPERRKAFELIKQNKVVSPEEAALLLRSNDRVVRPAVRHILNSDLVEKRARSRDALVRCSAAEAAPLLGKAGTGLLKRLSGDENEFVRAAVVEAAPKTGKEGVDFINTLANDPAPQVRWHVASVAPKLGKRGDALLERLAHDPSYIVRMRVAEVLPKTREGRVLLDELAKDSNQTVRETVRTVLSGKGKMRRREERPLLSKERMWLLATKKPLFAGDVREVMSTLGKMQRVTKQVQKEFGDKFIGIMVFGSFVKGYANKASDLDFAVIAADERVLRRTEELICKAGLEPCGVKRFCNPGAGIERRLLFNGLFFGDYDRLVRAQTDALEDMKPREWDRIRKRIQRPETNPAKPADRYLMSHAEAERFGDASILLRTLPPLDEMRQIARKRASALQK